jgi:hypothetical protein
MSAAAVDASVTRKDIEAKIVALAWQDEEFRRRFVADPKGQFEERLGTKLPASLEMTVHEEDENSLHFVIPMKPREKLDELSDEDLEKVSGGTDVTVSLIVSVGLLTAAVIASKTAMNEEWSK